MRCQGCSQWTIVAARGRLPGRREDAKKRRDVVHVGDDSTGPEDHRRNRHEKKARTARASGGDNVDRSIS